MIAPAHGRRLKRKVVDSDSDDNSAVVQEEQDDDTDTEIEEGASVEETLAYFNTASAEALQELTGEYFDSLVERC